MCTFNGKGKKTSDCYLCTCTDTKYPQHSRVTQEVIIKKVVQTVTMCSRCGKIL